MGEWDIPVLGAQPKVVDMGKAPIQFAPDWERKLLLMGVVIKNEIGEFHTGGFELTPASAREIGELMIKMALDLEDGGGMQPR